MSEAQTVEITEKQAILLLINSGWLVNHDKELREKWERPQGEWIIDGHHIRCNRCNEYICTQDMEGAVIPNNFCGNCGAKMKGGAENETN